MKKLGKAVSVVVAGIAACSVVVGVQDRIDQKKRERKAESDGRKIHRPYGLYEKCLKRPLDFFLSSVALLVLSPVMLVTALLVKVKLGSPVLFTQERPGRDERIFKLKKFRSMTDERDMSGELLPDEIRLTSFGKILRATSIDELPELFNIIKGDMSIVGPRPLLVKYLNIYTQEQHRRHEVRPGLTSYAMSTIRNSKGWDAKFKLDSEYVDRISFIFDLKIILWTIQIVLKHVGINEEGYATNSEYTGVKNEVYIDRISNEQQNSIGKDDRNRVSR